MPGLALAPVRTLGHPGTSLRNLVPARRAARGFTLIELVAAIVVLGAIVAVAVPVFRDLRYDARRAALEGIRATIVANATLARMAWIAQGGGSTVTLNGQAIDVFVADTFTGFGPVPAGFPTPVGMYVLLGCGASSWVPSWTPVRCAGLPGYLVGGNAGYLGLWLEAAASTWDDAYCAVGYWPASGYDPGIPLEADAGDPYWTPFQSSDGYYYPRSLRAGGC